MRRTRGLGVSIDRNSPTARTHKHCRGHRINNNIQKSISSHLPKTARASFSYACFVYRGSCKSHQSPTTTCLGGRLRNAVRLTLSIALMTRESIWKYSVKSQRGHLKKSVELAWPTRLKRKQDPLSLFSLTAFLLESDRERRKLQKWVLRLGS